MNEGWPHNTAVVTYPNMISLLRIVQLLTIEGHVFIVHPRSMQVAMSEEASRLIISWEG